MPELPPLLKPEKFHIVDGDGVEKTYILSNFPAVQGREIVSQYPMTAFPDKFGGDYAKNRELLFKLMSFVAVDSHGTEVRLVTEELVNNHVTDWETLGKIEWAMMEKNCRFFRDGRSYDFFENLSQIFLTKLSEILTRSSAQSSTQESPPITS